MSKKKTKKSASSTSKKKTGSRNALKSTGRRSKRGKAAGARTATRGSKIRSQAWFWGLRLAVVGFLALLTLTAWLDITIRKQFEGQKWALPAHVYTRPLELYLGQRIDRRLLEDELQELGYQQRSSIESIGSYNFSTKELQIHQRAFRFWDGLQPQQQLYITLAGERIESIRVNNIDGLSETEIVRLEPRLFGSVSPLTHEDRSLLRIEEVPPLLIDALIAIEDQQFYSHFGVNPAGILRAMIANLRAGRVVQGGSTLTQQLVKNYYLTSEQTFQRKFIEMIMAVLLEVHYSKEEILEAYLNEVYLSQAGNRAIHGFALGSRYFFGRPIFELELPELAMLAGIIKGPSQYNPLKNPQRARQRRDLVLTTMLREGYIDQQQHDAAQASELRLNSASAEVAKLAYPAFLGFLREQLQDQYQQQDILTDGLQIYTTLNPRIQQTLEQTVNSGLSQLEQQRGLELDSLQVAAVVIRTDNGEIAAMVGDRKANFSGYNRALQASRPVGSLLKPFVYLTALQQPQRYSLASRIDDVAITVSQRGSPDWQPQNYNNQEHGPVMLVDALAKSYNLATVRLGMEVGVDAVSQTVEKLGYDREISRLPSVLLGAVPMSVMDVGQLYLSLASGGFKTPLKGIRSVLSNDNEPLARYPLAIEQVIEPQFTTLITYALQDAIRNGTGRSVLNGFRYDYGLAGKTGTTDDYRDSWFAGFSGNYLTVVWVGRDDNKSTGLTGASGAARLWSKQMQSMPLQRLELPYHEDILSQRIYYSLDIEKQDCSLSRQLPVLLESLPLDRLPCAEFMQYDLEDSDEQLHFEAKSDKREKPSFWETIFGN